MKQKRLMMEMIKVVIFLVAIIGGCLGLAWLIPGWATNGIVLFLLFINLLVQLAHLGQKKGGWG